MALCGFNDKMLDALKDFFDGAVEFGIIDRSKKNGVSVEQQFQLEAAELKEWIKHSTIVQDSSLQKVLRGIGLMVAGLFEKDKQLGIADYKKTHDTLVNFLHEIDEMFYGKLEGNKENMPQLFAWADKEEVFIGGK